MDNKFSGFGLMAFALAAAGLVPQVGLPAAALLATRGRYRFILTSLYGGKKYWKQETEPGMFCRWGNTNWPDELHPDATIHEERWLDSFDDLSMADRKKQSAWVEGGKAGWLDREGNFYSCNYEGHGALARDIIHKEGPTLEEEGWIHVDGPGEKGTYTYRSVNYEREGLQMTDAQARWLEANGHDLDPHGNKKRSKMPEMITLGEGDNAVQIDKAADDAAFRRQMEKAGLNVDEFGKGKGMRLRDFR